MIVGLAELQKFKLDAIAFLLGVDGLQFALCPSVFKYFLYLVDFFYFLSSPLLLFFSYSFYNFPFLTWLSSLPGPSGFQHQAPADGFCSLECNDNNNNKSNIDNDNKS